MRLRLQHTVYLAIFLFLLPSAPLKAQCWNLVWSDEFDGATLNRNNWNVEINGDGGGNHELQYYTDRPENIRLENGNLVIEARQEAYLGKSYTSGRLTTQSKQFWTYGKVEAKMKLPYGKGMWPAFWMLGQNINTAPWPNCGEMDIMEMVGGAGNANSTVYGTFHWGPFANGGHPSYGKSYTLPSGKFADDFHVFSLEWSQTTASVFCDGVKYFTIDISPSSLDAFKNNFFVLLNLAVGGDWPGSPDGATVFPQKMLVDYVRVYSGSGAPAITGPNQVVKGQTGVKFSLPSDPNAVYSWVLPKGVSTSTSVTSNEITVNWGCEQETISCDVKTSCGTTNVKFPVAVKENEISSASFFTPSAATDLTFSATAVANGSYTWEIPADLSIKSGQSTNSITVNWGTNAGLVKLAVNSTCGLLNLEHPMLAPGLYPYPNPVLPHAVPGTINAVDYNYGGEGLAYHDAEAANQGTGPRLTEGVDTQDGDGGTNVGWTITDEWLTYTLKADHAGDYFPELRVASLDGTGQLSITFDGNPSITNFNVPSTSAWTTYTSVYPGVVSLPATATVMKIKVVKSGFNISRIIFWDKDTEAPSVPSNLDGAVSTNSINVTWTASTDNQKVKEYKVYSNGSLLGSTTSLTYPISSISANTTYSVEVVAVDLQGNVSASAKKNFTTLTSGVEEHSNSSFKVYPNPVSELLNVELDPNMPESTISIHDQLGHEIFSKKVAAGTTNLSIDFSSYSRGLYLIIVKNAKSVSNRSIIK